MLIISYKASEEFKGFLKENEIEYILTTPNPKLDSRIDDHPDLSLFKLDDNKIVAAEAVYDYYKDKLKGYEIIKGEDPSEKFPYDAIYNVVRFKDFYIHNDFTEGHIQKYFEDNKIKHLKVKQGYSRCSIIPLKASLITADFGIYKALKDKINIYLVEQDEIALDGFDQGFLGGCCGLVRDNLIFTGDISKHKAFSKLESICENQNIKIIYPKLDLIDYGSLICL